MNHSCLGRCSRARPAFTLNRPTAVRCARASTRSARLGTPFTFTHHHVQAQKRINHMSEPLPRRDLDTHDSVHVSRVEAVMPATSLGLMCAPARTPSFCARRRPAHRAGPTRTITP
jgi:hypothetical protein